MGLLPLLLSAFLLLAAPVKCGDLIPEQICATLHSEENYEGEAYSLLDFDQSSNLKKEYRHSLQGWESTGSIKVEKGCKATVCSEPYFLGTCRVISKSLGSDSSISDVASANCTCTRTCSCGDVVVATDSKNNGFYGRAYLKGGCSTCYSEYVRLQKKKEFPDAENRGSVEAFILAKGCSVEVFEEKDYKGSSIEVEGPVMENFKGTIESHRYFCEDAAPEDHPRPTNDSYPKPIDLPLKKEKLFRLTSEDKSLEDHPGVQIALESVKNSRSSKNAYVMLIGARVPYWLGFPQCQGKSDDKIWECHMEANMEHIGLKGQLRLITIPVGYNDVEVYLRLMATLDQFMSTHEELKEVIPNAVIVYHWITDSPKNFTKDGSSLRRKLGALHNLRNRLLDESYPNLVFLLDDLDGLSAEEERKPDETIAAFEEEITKKWSFPSPVNFVLRSDIKKHSHFVNGYLRMDNFEYYPKNLETSLLTMCDKGEDPLGKEILQSVFRDVHSPHYAIEPIIHDIAVNKSKIEQFRSVLNLTPTDISMTRAVAQARWENKKTEGALQKEIEQIKADLSGRGDHSGDGGGGSCDCDDLEKRIWSNLQKKLKKLFK